MKIKLPSATRPQRVGPVDLSQAALPIRFAPAPTGYAADPGPSLAGQSKLDAQDVSR
jgi:hypothetical protein